MKRIRLWQSLAWMSAIAIGASSGWAQSNPDVVRATQSEEMQARLRQLEQEVQMLRSQPQPTYAPVGDFIQTCCSGNNYYAGFEFVFLKPHLKKSVAFSTNSFSPPNTTTVNDILYEYNHDTSPRIILGMNNCEGLGVRGIYWTFDDSAGDLRIDDFSSVFVTTPLGRNIFSGTVVASQSLELSTFDLEVTQQFQLCQFYGLASAGARYGHYRRYTRVDEYSPGGPLNGTEWTDSEFHGIGPTVNLELLRPINCSCWSLYSKARGSILFGEADTRSVWRRDLNSSGTSTTIVNRPDDDSLIAIFDIQMGVQYDWGIWTFRGGWEGQFWDDPGEEISGDRATTNIQIWV